MVGVIRGQGIGRRLPPWLLGSKSGAADKHDQRSEQKFVPDQTSIEGDLLQSNEVLSSDSHLVQNCEFKRESRRKSRKQKRGDEKSEKIKESELRSEELESGTRPRKRSKNSSLERRVEINIQSPSNDEVDLTADDLLIIAKEYVEANKEMQHKQCNSRLLKTELSKNESETCVDHLKTSRSLLTHRQEVCCDSSACKSSVDVRKTGDPAQDMLDLFLGPLLKRPQDEKQTSEFITQDMEFPLKLERQRQRKNGGTEEGISLGKKKGSLKDKVAIFLD